MTTLSNHTTRGIGTILTATIYNTDHVNHVANAQALNTDKADKTTTIGPGAGLSGGGSLAADRTLAADFASQAEAEAGVLDTKVMSPLRTKQAIQTLGELLPVGALTLWPLSNSPNSRWLICQGQNVSRASYPALFAVLMPTATVTITIATPGVVTWTAHGRIAGDVVRFSTTGGLPTGITAGTDYYVISSGLATDSFRISATRGGSAINTTGSQSGVHTAVHAPYGVGDGSTTFGLPESRGEFFRGLDYSRGVDSGRAIGMTQTDMLKDHTHNYTPDANHNQGFGGGNPTLGLAGSPTATGGVNSPNNGGTETRPRNVVFALLIKAS